MFGEAGQGGLCSEVKCIIYAIECSKCKIQYVGQTRNKLLNRINAHLSDVRTKKDTPVSRHFNKYSASDYKLYVLHLCKKSSGERDKWENYWISRLNTLTPKGLNILD